mmetsp:Transcript_7156/g.22970  ORF Transcript_7156/g.22970 Transcript_7156/m.22970 type:complete len:220 (-) Transcript_7156:123-782(-)
MKVTMPWGRVGSPHAFPRSATRVEGGTTIGAKVGGGGGADTQTWRRESSALQTRRVLPSVLMATPNGWSNCAMPPMPSALPSVLPATVVTTPVATSNRRILLLGASATNRALPSGLTATPIGCVNCAAPPTPSAMPGVPLPARVVTAPVAASTCRILLPTQSATNSTLPSGLTAMPRRSAPSVVTLRTQPAAETCSTESSAVTYQAPARSLTALCGRGE